MPPAHSFARISAVGTSDAGLLPATWTPNIDSEGCLLTNDHSSLDPERNEWANPTTKSGEENHQLEYGANCRLWADFRRK